MGSAAGDTGDTPTAEQFLREKQPQTAQERALCFLYWATVVRDSATTQTAYVDDLNRRTAVSALAESPQTCSLKFPTRGIGVGVSAGS